MIESKKYTEEFFSALEANSYASAKILLPLLYNYFQPKSVVDVGCGTGMWLKVWNEMLGVTDFLGIEGPYVNPEQLKVPAEKIILKDLKEPMGVKRKFDLAMSLEVAEHLPASNAVQFIQSLTSLSDIILFSAALPHQQGTYHINEQYPEYWAKHFKQFDFIPVDIIRPLIWNLKGIEYWYKQNTLLYVNSTVIEQHPALADASKKTDPQFLTRIHPFLYELKTKQIENTKSVFGFLNWKWYVLKNKFKAKGN